MAFALAAHPRLLTAHGQIRELLVPVPNRFGASQHIAGMLIAHVRGCTPCFNNCRDTLSAMGFNPGTLDAFCELPDTLPLRERERSIVRFTLRMAREPKTITPSDFREMEKAGFSKEELLEMVGVASYWNYATTLATLMDAGIRDD
ncbi:MAG TPA: hypothetical protein VFV05_06810 [Methylomirabilota bacterium]|nr:hypothetical protein [Methylomirabilota bacterium]